MSKPVTMIRSTMKGENRMILYYTYIILLIILMPIIEYYYYDNEILPVLTFIVVSVVQFFSTRKLAIEYKCINEELSNALFEILKWPGGRVKHYLFFEKTEDPDRLWARKRMFVLWKLYFVAFIVMVIVSSM